MFKKGDKVRCIDAESSYLTDGKVYEVKVSESTSSLHDTFIHVENDKGFVTEFWASRFELIEEEKQMYEASDIKVGQVLLCVDNGGFSFWTTGKRYEVIADEQGKPCLYTDTGCHPLSHRNANDISEYLNNQPNNGDVVMQLIEDGKEEPEEVEPAEGITLTITGSNYQELLDQACELKRLLTVHVVNSELADSTLVTIKEAFGGAK